MWLDVEGCWRSWFKVDPLMQVLLPVPSRLPPWPRSVMFFLPGIPIPTEAHYAEVATLNPGLKSVAWAAPDPEDP